MLIQYPADVVVLLLGRACGASRAVFAAWVGQNRNRLSLRCDEVFVELVACLFECCGFSVEFYPVVVVWSDSVGALEDIVDVVFFYPHSVEDRVCKRGLVLENTAGEHVVDVRDVERAAYRGYHQLLKAGDDGIGYLFVL